jgi:L-iditol 2-dehydrogenase
LPGESFRRSFEKNNRERSYRMRVGVLYGPMDIRVEEIETPSPGPGEVLLEVKAGGICGGDLHIHRYGYSGPPFRREMSGHELSGRIAALGEDVQQRKVGDRVCVEPLLGCGRCQFCAMGQYNLCKQLQYPGGGFREYTVLREEKVFPVADHISYEEAAVIEPLSIGVHAVHRAGVAITDAVAVIGDGPIGLSVLQVAKAAGARKAALIGVIDSCLEVARKVGADMTVNASVSNAVEEAMQFTDGEGFEVVFEAVGGKGDTLETALQIAKRGGTVVALGSSGRTVELSFGLMMGKEINLLVSKSGCTWRGVSEVQIAAEMLARGELDAKSLITHTFPLDRIKEAFQTGVNKKETGAIKVLVTC